MDKEILLKRTKQFSIEVGKLVMQLSPSVLNKNYSHQITRSSSSVGANYRAACRAKSTADFINKLKSVDMELDETLFFLELLKEFNPDREKEITVCWKEGNELLSIIVVSLNTVRRNQNNRNS